MPVTPVLVTTTVTPVPVMTTVNPVTPVPVTTTVTPVPVMTTVNPVTPVPVAMTVTPMTSVPVTTTVTPVPVTMTVTPVTETPATPATETSGLPLRTRLAQLLGACGRARLPKASPSWNPPPSPCFGSRACPVASADAVTSDDELEDQGSLAHRVLRCEAEVSIGGRTSMPAAVLIDGGASHNFVHLAAINKWAAAGCKVDLVENGLISVTLGDGSVREQRRRKTSSILLTLPGWSETKRFHVLDDYSTLPPKQDIILGKPWLSQWDPVIKYSANEVHLVDPANPSRRTTFRAVLDDGDQHPVFPPSINFMSAKAAKRAILRGDRAGIAMVTQVPRLSDGLTQVDIRLEGTDAEKVKAVLGEFADVLPANLPSGLPPDRGDAHEIVTLPSAPPFARRPFRMARPEMDELRTQIQLLLANGFLEPSKSPWGAPVFFVPKPHGGGLRLVCDWRELNKVTVKNKACIPNPEDLFDRVAGAKVFSHLDLHAGYNQIRLREGDRHKTAINTPLGHYQFTVMHFGLSNAPATFQTVMNDVMRPFLHQFVVVFLDDILIYSRSVDEHCEHLRRVLQALRDAKLYAKPTKCVVGAAAVTFLGHIISGATIKADPEKISAVQDWPTPRVPTDVRRFYGFANYFRRFIPNFAPRAAPLAKLMSAKSAFTWTVEHQNSFDDIKTALTSTPTLKLPDVAFPFTVETDASPSAIAAVLQQDGQPVAFFSRMCTEAERGWHQAERELLALVEATRHWRIYLFDHFRVLTDAMLVKNLLTKKEFSDREKRWWLWLSELQFDIEHRRGTQHVAPDALSRRNESSSTKRSDLSNLSTPFEFSALVRSTIGAPADFHDRVRRAYSGDELCTGILRRLSDPSTLPSDELRRSYAESGGLLYFLDQDSGLRRLVVPAQVDLRLSTLHQVHDIPSGAHPGRLRTLQHLQRNFFWPRMSEDVAKYVRSCDSCQRFKTINRSTVSVPQPLETPPGRWQSIGMDLVTGLPQTKRGNDTIVTFVDRLTKRVHFAPTTETVDANGMATLFVEHIFRLHGLPRDIVSDRDPRFTSGFWDAFMAKLGVALHMSTANHPQSDGQTENANKIVQQALRAFCNHNMSNWDEVLPLVEYAMNNSVSSATGFTPFYLDLGTHPTGPADLLAGSANDSTFSDIAELDEFLSLQASNLQLAKDKIEEAKLRMREATLRGATFDTFSVNDMVMVHTDFILPPQARARGRNKLAAVWHGPFRVIRVVAPNAYELELPSRIRSHRVFSILALKSHNPNDEATFPDRVIPPPPPVELETGDEYVVQEILQHRGTKPGLRSFLTRYMGTGLHDAEWTSERRFVDEDGTVTDALRVYLERLALPPAVAPTPSLTRAVHSNAKPRAPRLPAAEPDPIAAVPESLNPDLVVALPLETPTTSLPAYGSRQHLHRRAKDLNARLHRLQVSS